MHTWFHVQLDQKILDGVYSLSLKLSFDQKSSVIKDMSCFSLSSLAGKEEVGSSIDTYHHSFFIKQSITEMEFDVSNNSLIYRYIQITAILKLS